MSKNNGINDTRVIPLASLEENGGQLPGLPANPREIAPEKFELLKEDIRRYPEFLGINALKVYPLKDGRFIVIGGNMRFRALRELGYREIPCVVIPEETPVESLKAYVVLDNSGFGQWDWAKLSSDEWDVAQLQDWGVDIPEGWECDEDIKNEKSATELGNANDTELRIKFDTDTFARVIEALRVFDEREDVALLKALGLYGE